MTRESRSNFSLLEILLILVAVTMTLVFFFTGAYRMVVLNLFYLPVAFSGFFLGRFRAGVLALFCALSTTIVAMLDLTGFAALTSPIVIGLAVTVWAAALGLTALLVGTLSDRLSNKIAELHEAYVGVVEVLSRYLQSADPKVETRSIRVARLCQSVAERMRLSDNQIDNIRVAALLRDIEDVEVTTRTLTRAIDTLETSSQNLRQHTFRGGDLVLSMGSVLSGALPLLIDQEDDADRSGPGAATASDARNSTGVRIIRAVRAYDALTAGDLGSAGITPHEALEQLRWDATTALDSSVLDALEAAVLPRQEAAVETPVHAT